MIQKIIYNLDTRTRLDKFLSEQLEISRSKIQKINCRKKVHVENKIVTPHLLLALNDVIEITDTNLSNNRHDEVIPQNIELNILFEDNDILVLNKPKNMVVHVSAGHQNDTLVNALVYHLKQNIANKDDKTRPGIVHRIDKDTSGILVVAKNDDALVNLQKQFKDHTIIRKYYGVAHGVINDDILQINLPIGRTAHDRKKMGVVKNGKDAVTNVKVLKKFAKFTLVECQLETGRTHQIRVHFSYIKHPLVGDNIYGYKRDPQAMHHQFLFAYYLGFLHPTTNKFIDFKIETPEYFNNFINSLK